MIKLLKDSIFKPKNLISYRAKSPLFVFLYVLLVSILGAIPYLITPLTYEGITEAEKIEMVNTYKRINAYIKDGEFHGETVTIKISDYSISFIDSSAELSSVKDSVMVVKGNIVYLQSNQVTTLSNYKVGTLTDLSLNFKEEIKFGNSFSLDSFFFKAIDDLITTYKPYITIAYGLVGLFSSASTMLLFGLINYVYLVLAFNAKQFMKKGQLYKMLVFATTAIVFGDIFLNLLNISSPIGYILIFVSFIPEVILEREIINRIRIKVYGDKIINNEDVINKINEMMNKKEEDSNNDESSDNDESEE